MKNPIKGRLRSGLALAALAVALIASVSGREKPSSEIPASAGERAALQLASQASTPSPGDIDLDKLQRKKKDGAVEELFAPVELPSSAHAPNAREARKPDAPGHAAPPPEPPLPFQYLGKVIDAGQVSVFLASGAVNYSAQEGQTLNNQYRIERISDAAVTFTYLPTGTRKVLAIPALN